MEHIVMYYKLSYCVTDEYWKQSGTRWETSIQQHFLEKKKPTKQQTIS